MDILKKIKSVLNENDIKSSLIKSKGLTHISFDNYKDRNGINYRWDESKNNFIKTKPKSVGQIKQKLSTYFKEELAYESDESKHITGVVMSELKSNSYNIDEKLKKSLVEYFENTWSYESDESENIVSEIIAIVKESK